MKKSKAFVLFAVVFLVYASKAWSCDFCSLHIGATPFEFNTTGIRIDTRIAFGNEIFVDGAEVANDQDLTGRFVTTQVTGFYRFSDKSTLFFILPYVDRTEEHLEEHDHGEGQQQETTEDPVKKFKTEGVGDVVLMTNYTFYNSSKIDSAKAVKFGFQFGFELPTGSTDQQTDGERAEMHLQPGSGSLDLLIGGMGQLRVSALSLYGDILFKVNGEGAHDYRFSNSVNVNLTGKYQVWPLNRFSDSRAFVLLAVNGEFSGHDKEQGRVVEDTGGDMVMLSPGINLFIKNNLLIEAIYQRPVYRKFNGSEESPQVVTSEKYIVGVQYLF